MTELKKTALQVVKYIFTEVSQKKPILKKSLKKTFEILKNVPSEDIINRANDELRVNNITPLLNNLPNPDSIQISDDVSFTFENKEYTINGLGKGKEVKTIEKLFSKFYPRVEQYVVNQYLEETLKLFIRLKKKTTTAKTFNANLERWIKKLTDSYNNSEEHFEWVQDEIRIQESSNSQNDQPIKT